MKYTVRITQNSVQDFEVDAVNKADALAAVSEAFFSGSTKFDEYAQVKTNFVAQMYEEPEDDNPTQPLF